MREQIERVIAELEVKKTEAEGKVEELIVKGNKWLAVGKAYGLEIAINQLKAVLAEDSRNPLLDAIEQICYHYPTPLGDDNYERAYGELKVIANRAYEPYDKFKGVEAEHD